MAYINGSNILPSCALSTKGLPGLSERKFALFLQSESDETICVHTAHTCIAVYITTQHCTQIQQSAHMLLMPSASLPSVRKLSHKPPHTAQQTHHTKHCTLHTTHCTLHTAHYKHAQHCTIHTWYCALHSVHTFTLHTRLHAQSSASFSQSIKDVLSPGNL